MPQTRRTFIQGTAYAGAAIMLAPLESFFSPLDQPQKAGFGLDIMATDWGFAGNRDAFCAAVKKEGYDGIEVWWPTEQKGQDELFDAVKKHGLKLGFLCGGWETDAKTHLATFIKNTTNAAGNKSQAPVYINCHSGRDHFTMEQNSAFIEHTQALSRSAGIPIYHETHRSRILFAAHIAQQYLEKFPNLQVTLDISHWCNVHESMLDDQPAAVELALQRAGHVHARIGHPEGPQVNDPRAPEWEKVVQKHIAWWDKIAARKKNMGERMTILTEFGPPDYMPTLPYTRKPVADQWGINVYMMQLLRKRYA